MPKPVEDGRRHFERCQQACVTQGSAALGHATLPATTHRTTSVGARLRRRDTGRKSIGGPSPADAMGRRPLPATRGCSFHYTTFHSSRKPLRGSHGRSRGGSKRGSGYFNSRAHDRVACPRSTKSTAAMTVDCERMAALGLVVRPRRRGPLGSGLSKKSSRLNHAPPVQVGW